MKKIKFTDNNGTFVLEDADRFSSLYFPLVNEAGMMSSITPTLRGDCKTDNNSFLLSPVSIEDLRGYKGARNFWLYDKENKEAWSVSGASSKQEWEKVCKSDETTTLEAGALWQKIQRTHNNICAQVLSFVPCDQFAAEIMLVTLENTSQKEVTLTPTAAIPLFGRSADNLRDHRHVTSLLNRVSTTEHGVILKPTLSFDERGHTVNDTLYCIFGAEGDGTAPKGFFPSVDSFVGEEGSLESPVAVLHNLSPENSGITCDGREAMGGIRFNDITLTPGAQRSFVIIMCIAKSRHEADECFKNYCTERLVQEALQRNKNYWTNSSNISLCTADKTFDLWMRWVAIGPLLRRLFGCSFLPHHDYGRGGRGWRDLWQDSLALLLMNPEGVRKMLVNNFYGVRMDGTNATIIGKGDAQFVSDRNNIVRVWMDHGMWPLRTIELYINTSGDFSILQELCPYFCDEVFFRGQKVDEQKGGRHLNTNNKEYLGTVFEHLLLQNLTAFYDVGAHNHMLLRGADWNDALDMAAQNGESVAFTAAYAQNLELLAAFCDNMSCTSVTIAREMLILLTESVEIWDNPQKKQALLNSFYSSCLPYVSGQKSEVDSIFLSKFLKKAAQWIKEHIRSCEWLSFNDIGWFNSYYDNSGNQVESANPEDVRMMLTGQVFCIMSGTATDEQTRSIISAADRFLFDEHMGGYRLNTDFKKLKTNLGRMFGFAYGSKENGAVFSHMSVMYAFALYSRGFVREGYRAIKALYDCSIDFEKSKMYPGIPEYFDLDGRGLYCYLTGASSWLLYVILCEMFGVKGKNGDLRLSPKLTAEQFDVNGRAAIKCTFAGKRLKIEYFNPQRLDFDKYKPSAAVLDEISFPANKNGEIIIERKDILALSPDKEHIITVVP